MSSKNTLHYSILKQPLGFRLLRIQPLGNSEHDDAPVRCNLDHYTLADGKQPDYTALSYCWGNPKETEDIIVNGCTASVTVNLESAIRQLRRDQLPDEIYVWADALCINQQDVREKTKQIELMPKIYAKANKVVTWLSQEDRDAEHLTFLNGVLSKNPNRRREQAAFNRAISTLSAKNYWSRIWIVQELSLARQIDVVCKDSRIPWSKFVQVSCGHLAQTLSPTNEVFEFSFLSDSRILELDAMRHEIQSKLPMPTLRALYRTRACQSTIKADRIFAVLGLTVDGASKMSKLRYQDSVNVTLLNLTLSEIEENGRLDPITFSDLRDNNTSVLRSWSPNWINRGLWQRLRVWQLHQVLQPSGDYFRATAPLAKLRLDLNKGELKLSGYCLGSICTEQAPCRLRYKDPSSISAAVELLIPEFPESPQTQAFQWHVRPSTFGLKPASAENDDLVVRAVGSSLYRSRLEGLANYLEPLALRRRVSSNDWLINNDSDDDRASSTWVKRDPARYRDLDQRYADEIRALLYLGSSYTANGSGDLSISEMCFLGTSKGLIGLGHASAKPGDQVYLLEGCSVPVILRERKATFEVVGEILVSGIMKGEYFQKKGGSVLASDFKQGDKEVVVVI